MNPKLHKMLAKKRDLSEPEKHAKMAAVHDLRGLAGEMMGDKMDGLKKVSVMSNSEQGLKHGLDKARGVLSGQEEHQMSDDAESPYSDAKQAIEEHRGEHGPDSYGRDPEAGMDHYSEGGEIQNPPDQEHDYESAPSEDENHESEELSPDQGDYSASDEESPAGHQESGEDDEAQDSDEDSEVEGMDEEELDRQLAKLMKMKSKMESRRS